MYVVLGCGHGGQSSLANKGKHYFSVCTRRGPHFIRFSSRKARVFVEREAWRIAHLSDNVNFVANNVNRRGLATGSETVPLRTESASVLYALGDRNCCLGYRKSCNAYTISPIAYPSATSRAPFSRLFHENFRDINPNKSAIPSSCHTLSKTQAVLPASFSSAWTGGGFGGHSRS